MDCRPPSAWVFVRAVWNGWASRVTGVLSIPFTLAGLYVDAAYYKALWFGLAVLSLVLTCYFVWKEDRVRLCEATEALNERKRKHDVEVRLAEFLEEGESRLEDERDGYELGAVQYVEWVLRVQTFLEEVGLPQYAKRFDSSARDPQVTHEGADYVGRQYAFRLERIHEFLRELAVRP